MRETVLIPSAIAFISMLFTLVVNALLNHYPYPFMRFSFMDQPNLLQFFVIIGGINLAIGYICRSTVDYLVLSSPKRRFVDYALLAAAFGVIEKAQSRKQRENKVEELLKQANSEQCCKRKKLAFQNLLLAELHVRIFSHAPQGLRDFFQHRNTLWYTAYSSIFASGLGWVFALFVIFVSFGCLASIKHVLSLSISFLIFFVCIPLMLHYQKETWSKEFWDVCWKWVTWDIKENPAPADWWRKDIDVRL